jgi:hypothetical protein
MNEERASALVTITREMREAGAAVIEDLKEVISASALAEEVYIAMAQKAPAKS